MEGEEIEYTINKFNENPINFIVNEFLQIYSNTKNEEVRIRVLEGLLRCTTL